MRAWKLIPLLLLVAVVINGCAGSSADSETAGESATPVSDATAPSTKPIASAPAAPAPAAKDVPAAPVQKTERITLPAGSEIAVILAEPLNSGKNKTGDEFDAHLADPLSVNGVTIFDRGAKVRGVVAEAESSGRVKGLARMRLILTSLTHNGNSISISTKSFFVEADDAMGRDAAVVGGGAGIGAAIGAIAGGKKGAATGAAIGGAAGAGTVLATKGKEVDFPAESKLIFSLSDDLTVTR